MWYFSARSPSTLENTVDRTELEKLALLARLDVDDSVFDEVSQGISDVLVLVAQLQAVDTQGVEPMAHPLDALQRLRPDEVTEGDCREMYQAIAPHAEKGLYLVPKVIE
jgi:aspartyl-tRNA(Asn)/glutamyl-tRNA(Gln) amidotransferase subunit C